MSEMSIINIYLSYAPEDEAMLEQLKKHLRPLVLQRLIKLDDDRSFGPGLEWREQMVSHLKNADIILILVSIDYIASNRCYEIEMPLAIERQVTREAQVIPIILRPCDWSKTPFGNLQALPSDGKPITSWADSDDAFMNVVQGIRDYLLMLMDHSQTSVNSTQTQTMPYNQPSQSSQLSSSVLTSQSSQSENSSQLPQISVSTQNFSSIPVTSSSAPPQLSPVISREAVPDAMRVATDKAVRRFSEDKLGFDIWITALWKFIISPDTTTPLSIGIDGAWGTGKSSFMYMLQNLLERPFSFGERWQEITWPWLKWLGPFIVTSPIWMVGKLMTFRGKNLKGMRSAWLQDIVSGLSYDPEIDTDIDLKKLSRCKRFWAKIAAWHCPKQPVRNPTIWFNAWKFDQEEQLWAALAIAVLEQIKKKYNVFQRIIFWVALEFKRFSWAAALYYIFLKIALPIALGLLAWRFDLFMKLVTGTYSKENLQAFGSLLPLSQTVLWFGAGLSGIIQISSIIKDPFQISIKRVFDKPDYKEKIGFIGRFEEDFSAIVSLVTRRTLGWKPRKLIIFIDDIDRCKLPKAVDIIEGINLFLDSEQCVFIIGMDITAVIASIETKYEDLFKQMHREKAGIVSPGRFFLDKIIQVPLHVPPPIEKSIDNLVEGIIERGVRPLQIQQVSTAPQSQGNTSTSTNPPRRDLVKIPTTKSLRTGPLPIDSASYTHEEVGHAIRLGARMLPDNPRQVKRFINLFRLYVYVANERNLFEEENQVGLTMDRLAFWVVWSLRWSDLVRHLSEEASLLASESDLVAHMVKMTKSLEKDGHWVKLQSSLNGYNDVPKDLGVFISDMRELEKDTPSHWSHLPWELWFRDRSFLKCAKELEIFWLQPQPNKINWLHTMLLMNKITSATTVTPTSNGSTHSSPGSNPTSVPPGL